MWIRSLVSFVAVWAIVFAQSLSAETLEVKEGRAAIVKEAPTGTAKAFPDRLSSGTRVKKIGEAPRYYSIELPDGRIGWSYRGHFRAVEETESSAEEGRSPLTAEGLLARTDVLKISVIDVEVGDATLIVCPEEDGKQDVVLIDTGEDDGDRILEEVEGYGVPLSGKPITSFIITHYDHDHCGDVEMLLPFAQVIYDHGDNNIKAEYLTAVDTPGVLRRLMTLNYHETLSGGVEVACVAVNQSTEFNPEFEPSARNDNPNSIALIISFGGFDYFTGGDLTFNPEKSLATGIRNCDVYHVNHHGSRATSSCIEFVRQLDPEVSIASNGAAYGHPTEEVADRLITEIGSRFFQTNWNEDSRAHKPAVKYVGDNTYFDDDEEEDAEGATGTIRVVVDPDAGKYFVLLPSLSFEEGSFEIED